MLLSWCEAYCGTIKKRKRSTGHSRANKAFSLNSERMADNQHLIWILRMILKTTASINSRLKL